jgi:hypothetical protein
MRRHPGQLISEHERLAEATLLVLERNLERLRKDAPEHVPAAQRALADIHLRRADRCFRHGRREEAEGELARALALAPRLGARALVVRLRARLRRKTKPPA